MLFVAIRILFTAMILDTSPTPKSNKLSLPDSHPITDPLSDNMPTTPIPSEENSKQRDLIYGLTKNMEDSSHSHIIS